MVRNLRFRTSGRGADSALPERTGEPHPPSRMAVRQRDSQQQRDRRTNRQSLRTTNVDARFTRGRSADRGPTPAVHRRPSRSSKRLRRKPGRACRPAHRTILPLLLAEMCDGVHSIPLVNGRHKRDLFDHLAMKELLDPFEFAEVQPGRGRSRLGPLIDETAIRRRAPGVLELSSERLAAILRPATQHVSGVCSPGHADVSNARRRAMRVQSVRCHWLGEPGGAGQPD
jgi:hypothetical protein